MSPILKGKDVPGRHTCQNPATDDLPSSCYVSRGDVLHLSNPGQLEMLRGMVEHGAPLRTEVRGTSMHPFVRDRDVLTISPLSDRLLGMGEIVAYEHPGTGRLTIHRIIGSTDSGWLIKGDNSRTPDGVISYRDIIGSVIRIERGGRDVRGGLGWERAWIAYLSRGNGLFLLKKIRNVLRLAGRLIFRFFGLPPGNTL